MIDHSNEPYYDRYSAKNSKHRENGYTMVLARPGRAEQASEFNEIQSMQRDFTEKLGKSIYKNGAIISGCEINIADRTVTIAEGEIFLDGLVRYTKGDTLSITGVGNEYIVASLQTSIVTYTSDSTLRDPAQGSENYNLVGADRERQVVVFTVYTEEELNNSDLADSSATVYSLNNGEILKKEETNDYSFITDTLASRTYDENGNYKVNGLNLQDIVGIENNYVTVPISAGKAYIRGYLVNKPSRVTINLNKSTSTRFVQSESAYYSSRKTSYLLSNGPVDTVTNITASVLVTGEMHHRGNVKGGYETLLKTPVQNINSVYLKDSSGEKTTIYTQGRDYRLASDTVDWSLNGDDAMEPASGTTYYVDYVYNYSMEKGKDYKIVNDKDKAYIVLLSGRASIVENSLMYMSYYYTLARRDLILLDTKGNITVMEGTPDKYANLLTPYNGSSDYLEIGYVNIYPTDNLATKVNNDFIAEVHNYDNVRLTQDNLINMMSRIVSLEDDIARIDLERSLVNNDLDSSLNGYFTDNFDNINKSDLTYVGGTNGDVAYTACIDYDREELTTQADILSSDLFIDENNSDQYVAWGNVIAPMYSEVLALKQAYATGTMKVNPYSAYDPMCKITIDPESDNWIDTNQITLKNTVENATYDTTTKVYSHGYWSRSATHNLRAQNFMRTETKTTKTLNSTDKAYSSNIEVASNAIEYMRSRDINIKGEAFTNNAKNIYAYFNEKPINLIATGSTTAGTDITINGKSYKTVNADGKGDFTAKITIPSKTPCGEVSVVVTDNTNNKLLTGKAVYKASGTLITTTLTTTTTITNHYKVLVEKDNLYRADPLAQSFIMDNTFDRNLVKLGLYFATKDNVRPAIVQIRNMVNGYPGETVYAEVTVPSNKVNIPTDKTKPVVTEVELNQPVYCKAGTYYCFIVLSDSDEYSLYYANLGDVTLDNTQRVVSNPYGAGVMFSSSNASTWTAHQGADLKFELYRTQYNGKSKIIFNNVTASQVTGVMLDATYEVDGNSESEDKNSVIWYYRFAKNTDRGTVSSEWLPIDTLVYRDLQSYATSFDLKAVIKTDYSTSPYIAKDRVSLRTFADKKTATYISKHIKDEFTVPYKSMKVTYQALTENGDAIKIYYMDEENGGWIEIKENGTKFGDKETKIVPPVSIKQIDDEFSQYTWNINKIDKIVKNSASSGATFFKLRIDLSTSLAYNRPRVKKLMVIFGSAFGS